MLFGADVGFDEALGSDQYFVAVSDDDGCTHAKLNFVCTPTCSPSFSYCARRTWSSAGFSGLIASQRFSSSGELALLQLEKFAVERTDLSASAASKGTIFVSIAVSSWRA